MYQKKSIGGFVKKGHEWSRTIHGRIKGGGRGCPYCHPKNRKFKYLA